MSRTTRLALVAVLYLSFVAALFVALFERAGSDDYAGWAPTLAALGLPACLVVALRRGRLGVLGALSLGIPAALCLACVTLLMLWPFLQVFRHSEELGLLSLLAFGPGAALVMSVIICRRLVDLPVRTGARRIVTIVAASGAFALAAGSFGWWGFWQLDNLRLAYPVFIFLLGALPLGWSLAPALTLLATRHDPASP
jgi:hypothetical protein